MFDTTYNETVTTINHSKHLYQHPQGKDVYSEVQTLFLKI